MNLKATVIVLGLAAVFALAVGCVTLAVLYAPAWLAFAGLCGYVLAIVGWIVSIALSGHKSQPGKPSVIVHEDGSIEVQP